MNTMLKQDVIRLLNAEGIRAIDAGDWVAVNRDDMCRSRFAIAAGNWGLPERRHILRC